MRQETVAPPFFKRLFRLLEKELEEANLEIAEMAANGKVKANGHANGKVVQHHAEEVHGYEFLGP